MLDFEQLKELTASWDYNQWPSQRAMEQARSTGNSKWWDICNHMQQPAAELMAWEACQWIAVLFETYGEAIELVSLRIELEEERGKTYHMSWFHVNDAICRPECDSELDNQTNDVMEAQDGKAVFEHVEAKLNDLGSFHFYDHVDWFNNIFQNSITSADEARARAIEHAPRIQAWFEQRSLENGTAAVETRGRHPGGTRL